jgi:nitroreductase
MKYMEKIEKRKSIREFKKKALAPDILDKIAAGFPRLHKLIPSIETELQIRTGDTMLRMEGVTGYRGKSFMAPCYLILLSEKADHYLENAGYMAEDLCLFLTELGISHCWLTADDSDATKRAALIDSDKEAAVVIACGYGVKERTKKRIDIHTPSNVVFVRRDGHIAPKISQEELVYQDKWGKPVDWLSEQIDPLLDKSFYAASLAPSFLNRQPYRYVLKGNQVILCGKKEEMTSLKDTLLDIGATMFNFDAIASQQDYIDWEMGEPEGIESVGIPEEYKAVAFYRWH